MATTLKAIIPPQRFSGDLLVLKRIQGIHLRFRKNAVAVQHVPVCSYLWRA
jgi:hypothetical protein